MRNFPIILQVYFPDLMIINITLEIMLDHVGLSKNATFTFGFEVVIPTQPLYSSGRYYRIYHIFFSGILYGISLDQLIRIGVHFFL